MRNPALAREFLQQCPFRRPLTEADLQALAAICEPVYCNPNGSDDGSCYVFREGDIADGMYLLCSGSVQFVSHNMKQEKMVFNELKRGGHFFGEVAVFNPLSGTNVYTRTAAAVATSELKSLKLNWNEFKAFLRSHPNADFLLDILLEDMAERIRRSSSDLNNPFRYIARSSQETTSFDSAVAQLAKFCSSLSFVLLNLALLIGSFWLTIALHENIFNAASLLGLVLTLEAVIVATIVLNNQFREARFADQRDREQHQYILTTSNVIAKQHQEMERLTALLNASGRLNPVLLPADNAHGEPLFVRQAEGRERSPPLTPPL